MLLRKIKYGAFGVFIAALVAALYLSLIGLPDVLARKIEQRLQFSGLVITLEKVKLGLFEGIIATHVRCHRKGDIGVPLLDAEKIVLYLQPLAWLKGEDRVSGALVKNGIVSIPVQGEAPDGAAPRFERLNLHVSSARVAWNSGRPAGGAAGAPATTRLRVEEYSARMPGINLTGRGELVLPRDGAGAKIADAPGKATAESPGGRQMEGRLAKWLAAWGRCGMSTNGSGEMNVDATFFADSSDINSLDAMIRADARNTCIQNTALGAWRLKLNLKGAGGAGVLEMSDANIEGAAVAKLGARFRLDDQSVILESLEAAVGKDHWSGPFHLSGVYDRATRQYRGAFSGAFNPNALLPMLYAFDLSEASFIEWFQFNCRPPVAKADFRGAWGTNAFFHLAGQVQGDNCQYNGITNLLMKSDLVLDFSPTNALLTLANLLVVREEGTLRAGALLDFNDATVSFDGFSTADPRAVAGMLDPFIADIVAPFRFDGAARVSAWGTAGYAEAAHNDLEIEVDAQRAGWAPLLMDRCSLNARVVEDSVYINDLQADFCRGLVSGSGVFYPVLGETNLRYHVAGDLREVNMQALARALTGQAADQYRGYLSGRVELEGALDDPGARSAVGRGWVQIGGGRLFQIPLFGGLSEFMGRIVPGLSLIMQQTKARASFVVKDGKLHSDNIVIEGEVITITGKGDYHFNGDLDFAVQVKLLKEHTLLGGILQIAMAPVTKMLQLRLTGTVKNPRWRPAYLPKEMFFIFD